MTEYRIGASDPLERYRYVPGHEVDLGSIGNLFYSTLSRQHQLLSRTEAGYVVACNRFATLEEHANRIGRRLGPGDQDHAAVEETLKKACERGLLVAERDFFTSKYNDVKGQIDWIAVPTRDRPELLCRTINSFAQNSRAFDRTTNFFVSDGDCKRQSADRCKAMLQDLACREHLSIVYSGNEEKLAYAEQLTRASGVPIDVLHFALFGLPECACNVGANRNAVLLHSVGTLNLNVDDDVLCELTLPPDANRQGLWLESEWADVSDVWLYPDLSDLRNAITPLRESVLDTHERLLGKTIRSVVAEAAELADIHLDSACPHILKSLKRNTGSVVVTYNGIAGNPGMHNRGSLLLARSQRARDQLTASERQYQLGLTGGEMVRAASHTIISHGGPWTGGSFGLDNRDLLPPFLPVQRGEDGLFGFLLSSYFPDCYFAHIPETVLHAPTYLARCGDPADAFSHLQLSEIFVGLAVSAPKRRSSNFRAEQMSQLGSYLSDVSSVSDDEFDEFLKSILWSRASRMAATLDHLLVKYRGEPAFWAADIRRGLQALSRRLRTGEYTVPSDLLEGRTMVQARKLTKAITAKYGQLLVSWPAIVAAARDLRQQGKEFGNQLTGLN
jgi:hypothetical protein